jgi:glycosyltransferase involved in cell wall biosynthesis
MPPRVTILVHGGPEGIEAIRARGLSRALPESHRRILYREGSRQATLSRWHADLKQHRPDLLYVLNTALPGAPLAAWWRRIHGLPFVLDTGDVIYEMARESGISAGWRLPLLWATEQLAWKNANLLVVRGTRHREYFTRLKLPAALIRDGYAEQQQVDPQAVAGLRERLGLSGRFVVGVMGSLVFSPKLQICYGWDLIQALKDLADLPVTGMIIGDGNGRSWLEAEARRLGVQDRLVFTGRIPYAEVPTYLRLFDVALSTQTNNLPGQVRTTGKVPEYMAAERYILASRVGEAELLLPPGMLLDYQGAVDPAYPGRLARRIRELVGQPTQLEARRTLPALAARTCSYDVLAQEWLNWINQTIQTVRR